MQKFWGGEIHVWEASNHCQTRKNYLDTTHVLEVAYYIWDDQWPDYTTIPGGTLPWSQKSKENLKSDWSDFVHHSVTESKIKLTYRKWMDIS